MKKQATDLVACFFVARRCEGTTKKKKHRSIGGGRKGRKINIFHRISRFQERFLFFSHFF
ncbi:MAG: hypothetical protein IJ465_06860 [Clostridia bacterium]|nr:hypothetical protein [Clostridia bacterium]